MTKAHFHGYLRVAGDLTCVDISHKLQVCNAFLNSCCPCISTMFMTNEKRSLMVFTEFYISGLFFRELHRVTAVTGAKAATFWGVQ